MNSLRKQRILEKLADAKKFEKVVAKSVEKTDSSGGAKASKKERKALSDIYLEGGTSSPPVGYTGSKEQVAAGVSTLRKIKAERGGKKGYHDIQYQASFPVSKSTSPARARKEWNIRRGNTKD